MTQPQGTSPAQKIPVSIQDEMRTSYLDYAMSVIIGRAIPDVRDGLKPVHRRILFSANEQNLNPGSPHKKSAKVVGDVLANYHPHGDASVYDAMVRLAQDFSMRYPLIDGQGNFGSIDGDPPAAYRYTEARLSRIAAELLVDIDKECVDFQPNFDDSKEEPRVLPTRIPNLLVNGSGGIAVGMATNVPPHNLGEIVDAVVHLIRNPGAPIDDLMRIVPGPDFPTGGIIYGRGGIELAQRTGRGSIIMRARMEVEKVQGKGEREQIVVVEMPYQVNKARVHAKIGELMREKKIEGISEARDESDRDGIRLVIELKKDVLPQVVINQLYRQTDLQTTFGVINLAIHHNRPAVLDLKETLSAFVEHRRDVVTRRSRFELRQAEAQREIIEGLGMAITEVDLVIRTIRAANDSDEARIALMKLPLQGLEKFVARAGRPQDEIDEAKKKSPYTLSERQAKAILEMRLSRLTGLETEKLATEYGTLSDTIARLRAILADTKLLFDVIVMELEEIRAKYADKRRTEIVANEAEITDEDLIQEEDMVVTISHAGYIKRTAPGAYRAQKRGGKGRIGMEAREEDWVTQLFVASTHAYVFFFSDRGKVFVKKVYEIPIAPRTAKGRAIVNFVGIEPGEKVAAVALVPKIEGGKFVATVTRRGQIKKTELTEYENFREKGIIGVKIEDGDQLLSAALTDGEREFLIATKMGQSIRFPESQVRAMGRSTVGVKAIDVSEGDEVVGIAVTDPERNHVLAVCENGFGKRTLLEEFRVQNRGGKGIILIDASDRNGPVVDIKLVNDADEVMLITDQGQTLRTRVAEIRETGRNAQGVKIMSVGDNERVVALERLAESPVDEDGGTGSEAPPGASNPPSMPPPEGDRNQLSAAVAKRGAPAGSPKRPPAKQTPAMIQKTLARLQKLHPDAHCELVHDNPFELLVATVLSAQATDVSVNKATPQLFAKYPDARSLAKADPARDVEPLISTIGMFRQKSRNIVGLAKGLVERHGGEVPRTLDELVELPGVGRKTANVVLGVAFGAPEGVVVDTHVQRIAQRLGWTKATEPAKIETDLCKAIPRSLWDTTSHVLIFHGRRICFARKPNCEGCGVSDACPSAFKAETVGRKAARPR